jgi:hypothetical protein
MRREHLAFALLLTLAFRPPARARDIGSFRYEARSGRHVATLVLKTKAFDRSRHRVKVEKVGELLVTMVDGRAALGTDGGTPGVEIESFRFTLDGREVPVPRRLYSDCFDPGTGAGGLALKFGQDAGSVFVFMRGSDGAGVYDVVWTLRGDGRHSRWANAGGDCSIFNFDCGLDGRRQ